MTTNHSPLPSNEAGPSFVDIAKEDPAQAQLLVPNNGSVMRMVDIPPKSISVCLNSMFTKELLSYLNSHFIARFLWIMR